MSHWAVTSVNMHGNDHDLISFKMSCCEAHFDVNGRHSASSHHSKTTAQLLLDKCHLFQNSSCRFVEAIMKMPSNHVEYGSSANGSSYQRTPSLKKWWNVYTPDHGCAAVSPLSLTLLLPEVDVSKVHSVRVDVWNECIFTHTGTCSVPSTSVGLSIRWPKHSRKYLDDVCRLYVNTVSSLCEGLEHPQSLVLEF